jgi:hypothetical protein
MEKDKMNEHQKKWLKKHGYGEIAIKEIDMHQKILLGKRDE